VLVALLGALDRLVDGQRSPAAIAREAHLVETERLGQQSGVQDQLCAAYGGINFIDIVDYPRADVRQLPVREEIVAALGRRLLLIYLGRPHQSSAVHERVLKDLARVGPDSPHLRALRAAAVDARDALVAGDLAAFGKAMRENTDAQAALHDDLVHREVWDVIGIARDHGAAGWKVNGAGGDGGSLTILTSDRDEGRPALLQTLAESHPHATSIPIELAQHGLRVW
jgi:D-glycero-alpha-D-manno-heptose-7-phosphate kinase